MRQQRRAGNPDQCTALLIRHSRKASRPRPAFSHFSPHVYLNDAPPVVRRSFGPGGQFCGGSAYTGPHHDPLVDVVVSRFGLPLPDAEQLEAPWACTGLRQPWGVPPPAVPTEAPSGLGCVRAGGVPLPAAGVLDVCSPRYAPAPELLGLRAHQRRTERLSELAALLAVRWK